MAQNSAVSTSSPMSFEDYYAAYGGSGLSGFGGNSSSPYSLGSRIKNFFTGEVDSMRQKYENYLADFEYKRNAEASAKANQETYDREDSQVQRLMDDYYKAGLNPYVILNSGNLSGGVVSSQAQKPSYKKKSLESSKDDSKLMNTAVKILALLLLKKAI